MSSIYQIISSTLRYLVHPSKGLFAAGKTLTILLALQQAARLSLVKAEKPDFCPADLPGLDMLAANQCFPAEVLFNYYHVITDYPINTVKIFLFAQHHDNATHHKLDARFARTLATPSTVILFEGVAANYTFDCRKFCVDKKTYHIDVTGLATLDQCDSIIKLRTQAICKGWEDDSQIIYNKFYSLSESVAGVVSEVNKLNQVVMTVSQALDNFKKLYAHVLKIYHHDLPGYYKSRQAGLSEIKKAIDGFAKEIAAATLTKASYETIPEKFKELMHGLIADADHRSVLVRNKSLKKAIKRNLATDKTQWIKAGYLHLFPDPLHEKTSLVEPADPQYELVKFLDDSNLRHARLIPKL